MNFAMWQTWAAVTVDTLFARIAAWVFVLWLKRDLNGEYLKTKVFNGVVADMNKWADERHEETTEELKFLRDGIVTLMNHRARAVASGD